MSLFIVNRFDENASEENDAAAREEKRLRKLRKLIEKRKSERSIVVESANEEILPNPENVQSEKEEAVEDSNLPKKKKPKTTEDVPENVEIEEKPKTEDPPASVDSLPKREFKILGVKDFAKKREMKVSLPHWLSSPKIISIDLKSSATLIDDIPYLNGALKKKLKTEKIERLFPVQAEVIPFILRENKDSTLFWPKDVCVSAPTGSGKTLAYVLPIVQLLTDRMDRQIRALVILPVKELAEQVGKVFKSYCIGTNLKVLTATGSLPFSQERPKLMKYTASNGWQSEIDILVCTPGRLVTYLRQAGSCEGFTLRHLQFLIIDEADRIMDHIQNDWLHHFNESVGRGDAIVTGREPALNAHTVFNRKRPPQKLFFSATFSHDPEKLKQWGMFQPKLFTASTNLAGKQLKKNQDSSALKFTVPMELKERFVICEAEDKPMILYNLIKQKRYERILCFTNSSQTTHLLTILLNNMGKSDGIDALELSSSFDINNSRRRVLQSFQSGNVRILVCTDALARGIDIRDCDSVISYDPPKNTKTYIHRIGRTARAGKEGTAIAILTQNQHAAFKEILKPVEKSNIEKIPIEPEEIEKLKAKYAEAQTKSKRSLKDEKMRKVERLKATKRGIVKKVSKTSQKRKKQKMNKR